jgi:hypothetical protein
MWSFLDRPLVYFAVLRTDIPQGECSLWITEVTGFRLGSSAAGEAAIHLREHYNRKIPTSFKTPTQYLVWLLERRAVEHARGAEGRRESGTLAGVECAERINAGSRTSALAATGCIRTSQPMLCLIRCAVGESSPVLIYSFRRGDKR